MSGGFKPHLFEVFSLQSTHAFLSVQVTHFSCFAVGLIAVFVVVGVV